MTGGRRGPTPSTCPVRSTVKLHERLIETRDVFHLSPANVQAAVQIALELARLPVLEPVDHPGAPKGTVFRMPAFQGAWARCAEGLDRSTMHGEGSTEGRVRR
jgi:hypothetical protein